MAVKTATPYKPGAINKLAKPNKMKPAKSKTKARKKGC